MNHIDTNDIPRSIIEIRSHMGTTRITVPAWWTIQDLTMLRLTLEAAGYHSTTPGDAQCIAAYAPGPPTGVDVRA